MGAGSIGQGWMDGCWIHWTGVDGWVLDPLDRGGWMGAGSIGHGVDGWVLDTLDRVR